jgi:hypothetical protein
MTIAPVRATAQLPQGGPSERSLAFESSLAAGAAAVVTAGAAAAVTMAAGGVAGAAVLLAVVRPKCRAVPAMN